MRVAERWRRCGLGTQLLRVVDSWLDGRDCYCVPYSHLPGFYGQIGFKEITPESAPPFLAEYKLQDLDVALMARIMSPK